MRTVKQYQKGRHFRGLGLPLPKDYKKLWDLCRLFGCLARAATGQLCGLLSSILYIGFVLKLLLRVIDGFLAFRV